MGDKKVSLKLLVDTKANKVLFAEASKDFVDFIFHILSLPIGTAISMRSTMATVGCLGDVYKSVETFSSDYLQPDFNVNSLLKPSSSAFNVRNFHLLKDSPPKKFYGCPNSTSNFSSCSYNKKVSDSPAAVCPGCGHGMSSEMTFVASKGSSSSGNVSTSGYVKEVTAATYIIMDNLEVKPMSTISAITLINQFNVKDVASLVEKQVQFDLNEGTALMKASLETRAVLTAVFLANNL